MTDFQSHGLTATALTTTGQLKDEGSRMFHMVSAWGEYCMMNVSRVFRIEQDGHPVATGEIVHKDDGWVFRQVRGPKNIKPVPEARLIMEDIALEYTRLERERSQPLRSRIDEESMSAQQGPPSLPPLCGGLVGSNLQSFGLDLVASPAPEAGTGLLPGDTTHSAGPFKVHTYQRELTLLCSECNWVMSLKAHILGRNPFFRCGNCRLEVEINSGI